MEQKDYRLAAIMYTDIAGFSRMMERDESGTLELLTFHNELIGEIVTRHHGTVIKTIGDALLVDFKNTVEAMQSALEIQDKLYAHNKERARLPLLVRIGLHLGDIYFFENDALGEGINIAARLQSLASPGCICFSQDVYNLVLNKIEFRAEKLGKVSLKNITKEIHAYEITTPNVEFDPDRDRPRAGYNPGSYLDDDESSRTVASNKAGAQEGPAWARDGVSKREKAAEPAPESPVAPAAPLLPEAPPVPEPLAARGTPRREADRSYTAEASASLLTEIRKAILQDIKAGGRRITVEEARERYGFYGVEAQEVIAEMADQGLLVRTRIFPEPGFGTRSAATDIGKTIEAAVHGIVTEIERSALQNRGGAIPDYASETIERVRDKMERKRDRWELRMERRAARHGEASDLETSRWDKKLDEDEAWKEGSEGERRDFHSYRESLLRKQRSARAGFIGNFVSFLGVNGFLWFINLTSSPGFHWAAIVTAAWGIGVASSAAATWRAGVKAREVENLPELDSGQLGLYKKLNRVKDSIIQHASSALTVTILLAQINLMTDTRFLWFLIPGAALVISFVSHFLAYLATKPRLEREFKKALGVTGGWGEVFSIHREAKATADNLGAYAGLWREAEKAKADILEQTRGQGGIEDLKPALDEYVSQVKLLAASASDIDRIVDAIPMAALKGDKEALLVKERNASSPDMKAEYHRSVGEIEKQEGSWEDLRNQSEIIRLRLGSAVNQLKQTRIDIARLKAAGDSSLGGEGIGKLRARTEELSQYLEDLRKGYDETRKDPFAELEKAAEKAETRNIGKAELGGPGPSGT
ncbi:MAG: adenylate/guanylate cyclase domain-containing protein [Spirochaetota bacterium]